MSTHDPFCDIPHFFQESKGQHNHYRVHSIVYLTRGGEAGFEGKYYQVRGAINQPKGVQKPHIPLLIGGGG